MFCEYKGNGIISENHTNPHKLGFTLRPDNFFIVDVRLILIESVQDIQYIISISSVRRWILMVDTKMFTDRMLSATVTGDVVCPDACTWQWHIMWRQQLTALKKSHYVETGGKPLESRDESFFYIGWSCSYFILMEFLVSFMFVFSFLYVLCPLQIVLITYINIF